VSADVNGILGITDMETRKKRLVPTHTKHVRLLRFAPNRLFHLLVISKEGEFLIADIEQCTKLSNSSAIKARDLRALDGGWLDDGHPVIATADGALRVFDLHCAKSNSAFDYAFEGQLEHSLMVLIKKGVSNSDCYLRYYMVQRS
jgi:hypothetical protein